jgi:hypothetical protein
MTNSSNIINVNRKYIVMAKATATQPKAAFSGIQVTLEPQLVSPAQLKAAKAKDRAPATHAVVYRKNFVEIGRVLVKATPCRVTIAGQEIELDVPTGYISPEAFKAMATKASK